MFRKLSLAVALLVATPAAANDVTLTFTDQEQEIYIKLIDAALKCGGVNSLSAANQLLAKLQAARMPAPPKVEPKK